jgi:hypothetical protein
VPRKTVRRSAAGDRALLILEYFVGITALVGGLMLVARPDGSLLQAKMSALSGGPFEDWRVPGILLATLVGGEFLFAAEWQRRSLPLARELSILAGAGLVGFELSELVQIGFQPLEMIFGATGSAVLVLSVRQHSSEMHASKDDKKRRQPTEHVG